MGTKSMTDFSTYSRVPTYAKLVEAVQVYLNRYDQDTLNAIPFFINMAEKIILRQMRMPSMEKMVGFTLEEIGEPGCFVQLPFDYLEMRYVWVKGSTLQRVTFDQLVDHDLKQSRYGYGEDPDSRGVWAINANRMYIRGVPDTEQITMTYYADIPEISETTQSNILLDLVPDAFLYFAVAEGFKFLNEPQRAMLWQQDAQTRLIEVRTQIEEAEFSGSPLVITPKG